jgi:hypothetical protein
MRIYGELASIRETVDLSEQEALDSAQAFLMPQGYSLVQRTETSLTVERHTPDHASEESSLNITVVALLQPEGGVQIKVRGNDREGMAERQAQWMEWSESLPKRTSSTEVDYQQEEHESLPAPADLAAPEVTSDVTAQTSELHRAVQEEGIIFDKQDQLEKIKAGLLPGEQLEAVFDAKGGGTGFVGITSKRVIFQDNAWVMNTKAVVSIPYSRIHTVAAEDQAGLFAGRGFFSGSKIVITTSEGPKTFQFRGADKAHIAHDLILKRMI